MKINKSIELTQAEIIEAVKLYIDNKCHSTATKVEFTFKVIIRHLPFDEMEATAELTGATCQIN